MCTRYWTEESPELRPIVEEMNRSPLVEKFVETGSITMQGEVRPTNVVPVIASNRRGEKAVYPMKWGFSGRTLLVNARSETAATKPKKSLLDFIDSLDIDVDGISPDQPHIKDNTLFLEYYFFGEYTPEDEDSPLPTPESEEPSLFSGYMQRLAVISQYIEAQVEKNGYSISKIVVEGYDSTGKQFYHIQSSPKS